MTGIEMLMADHAKTIIRRVMSDHKIGIKDFRSSLMPAHVKARADAIRRLSKEGFSEIKISELMGINPTTVAYWIRPSERARRLERRNRAHAEARV